MSRRRTWDDIDEMCMHWAVQRRKALGIGEKDKLLEPRERLGKIRSTLGAVREEGEGASYSSMSQNWPEVYLGESLIVHRCWWSMKCEWREVMHVHYVWRGVEMRELIKSLGISSRDYYERLSFLKQYLGGYVRSHTERVDVKPGATYWRAKAIQES